MLRVSFAPPDDAPLVDRKTKETSRRSSVSEQPRYLLRGGQTAGIMRKLHAQHDTAAAYSCSFTTINTYSTSADVVNVPGCGSIVVAAAVPSYTLNFYLCVTGGPLRREFSEGRREAQDLQAVSPTQGKNFKVWLPQQFCTRTYIDSLWRKQHTAAVHATTACNSRSSSSSSSESTGACVVCTVCEYVTLERLPLTWYLVPGTY